MPTINLGNLKKYRAPRTLQKKKYQEVYQDPRWRKLRDLKFRNNPLCEVCEARGLVVMAEEIHHIQPFDIWAPREQLEALAYDYNNLKSVCIPCHKDEHKKLIK